MFRLSPDWTEQRHLEGRIFEGRCVPPPPTWMEDHVHPDDRERVFAAVADAIQTRSSVALEHRVLRDDGGEAWVFTRAVPLLDEDGTIREWFGMASDVTERRRAQEALVKANELLREADRRKDEFLGMLSHELRNPLAPVRNATWVLRHAEPGSEQVRRAQAIIERQTEHLARLVEDLLDVTRIAREKLALRRARVDLREVVSRAAEGFRLVLEGRGVTFRADAPAPALWADADPTRIAQVVGNLLHNAAKFTRPGDEVALRLDRDGDMAELGVRDTGVGIDAALLPRVFEPFTQGERSPARTDRGLGLGLALVKAIAELHGGSVRAASAGPGTGAEFVVRIPILWRAG